jgi:hypothetical protein
MLRKMVFGPHGRLSTDLDFTCRSDIANDDLTMKILEVLESPYHGIAFRFERDKDWYLTEDGCASNPVCSHAENEAGVKVKLQVSTRERPILPVREFPQIEQKYFVLLPFRPAAIPCLGFEEVIAEKMRAASQRSRIRDVHDLSELATRVFDRDLVRSLAVLKLWNSGGPGLDFEAFRRRIEDGDGFDLGDLRRLLRRNETPNLQSMMARVTGGFEFLQGMTQIERTLAADGVRRCQNEADTLLSTIRSRHEPQRGRTA